MRDYVKNHRLALALAGITILTILRIVIPFSSGYTGKFFDIFLFFTEPIRYVLIVSYAILIIASTLNRKRKVLFSLVVVFFISIGLIPTAHFMTLGALLSIHNANPEQIRNDAIILLDEYREKAHFSDNKNQRIIFHESIPKNKLPLSLQNENINEVLVLHNYVYLEKFGLSGLFRGFVVFREDADIWKNDKPIVLLDGCSYCWKIRVIDGLYWYHAVPIAGEDEVEVPSAAFPLK